MTTLAEWYDLIFSFRFTCKFVSNKSVDGEMASSYTHSCFQNSYNLKVISTRGNLYHRHHHCNYKFYFNFLAMFISLLFIDQVYADYTDLIDRSNEPIKSELKDLNSKIAASEKILLKLLSNNHVQSAIDLKEHVEKMIDYLRFRQIGINTWKINRHQFEVMKNGINQDYAALPFKIVHILSQATKDKIIHVVPYYK